MDIAAKTDQNNLNSQSYTRLNIPAIAKEFEKCPLDWFWGERLPVSRARLDVGGESK
jgi:hypothetical protein